MNQMLSVDEAVLAAISELEEYTGWKYVKSQRRLKKKCKDIELVIDFFTSKWNHSYEYVGINAEFSMVYKKLGKLPVQNTVAVYCFRPKEGNDTYWFDISSKDKLVSVIDILKCEIDQTALYFAGKLESDCESAVRELLEKHFDEYHVRLAFVAAILGDDAVVQKAHEIYDTLSDEERQQVEDYKNGAQTMAWMLNPSNLKYIIDNHLVN